MNLTITTKHVQIFNSARLLAIFDHLGLNLSIKTYFQCSKHPFRFGLLYIKGGCAKNISQNAIITHNYFANVLTQRWNFILGVPIS